MSRQPIKDRMLTYLPQYYQASRVMEAILSAQGQEIDKLFDALDQILDQFFINTATWGLTQWEELLGLPINETTSVNERRQKVLAKRRGLSQPLLVILQAIAPGLDARFGGDIISFILPAEHNANEYDFGLLVPTLEISKPAHKAYSFQLLPPDQASGYVIYGDHDAGRDKIAFQIESGTTNAGRWPRWNTIGQRAPGNVITQTTSVTGESIFPIAGVSIGSRLAVDVAIFEALVVGTVVFPRSGQYWSAEMPISSAVGTLVSHTTRISSLSVTGDGDMYPCGTIYSGEVAA